MTERLKVAWWFVAGAGFAQALHGGVMNSAALGSAVGLMRQKRCGRLNPGCEGPVLRYRETAPLASLAKRSVVARSLQANAAYKRTFRPQPVCCPRESQMPGGVPAFWPPSQA